MSEDNENKPTLGRKPLGIKRPMEAGEVKQTFSHGRTNKVVVEVKRRKLVGKPGSAPAETPAAPEPVAAAPVAPAPQPVVQQNTAPLNDRATRQEIQARLLREAEEARLAVAEEARRREEDERARAAENERMRAEQKAQIEAELAASPAPVPAADAAPAAPKEDVAPAAPAPVAAEEPAAPATAVVPPPRRFTPVEGPKRAPKPAPKVEAAAEEEAAAAPTAATTAGAANAGVGRVDAAKKGTAKDERPRGDDRPRTATNDRDRRQSGKLSVNRALNDDDGARARSLAALKRAREKEKRSQSGGRGRREVQPKQSREVVVPEAITVQELANRMAEKGADLVKALFKMDMPVTINEVIDQDTAELLVEEFGHTIKRVSDSDVEIVASDDVDAPETLKPRPPVVTVMGHVDHGKTSLLDALRGANVQAGEAGGITQHIGAYQVKTKDGQLVTFLDTPGHAAFTEMRQRGAMVTDIVILVVAADDGLMPQTIEAIKHSKAAGVPLIIAINKIDKEGANPQKVRERLLEHEIVVEQMGGEVQDVEVSALKKLNLDELLEKLALQAEVMELSANPDRQAEAVVVEAQLDKGRGAVATVLIKRGTLKRGDIFVVGEHTGKVRALVNDRGEQVKEATPSQPVEVLGLSGVPSAGDVLTVVDNEARAREVAAYRAETSRAKRTTSAPVTLENMFSVKDDKAIEYPVVIRADVQGSTEAIVNALTNLSNDEIRVRVLQSGVGAITEGDVTLAQATGAPIIGFNVRPNAKARQIAEREKVRFKYFDVIYHLTEDIAKEMAGELGPEIIETVVGRAEVKDVFKSGKRDKAAGLLVLEGVIKKGLHARLTRDDVIVSKTTIGSLRRFKDVAEEVRAGMECGVVLSDTNDIKTGDMLEVFEVEERERVL